MSPNPISRHGGEKGDRDFRIFEDLATLDVSQLYRENTSTTSTTRSLSATTCYNI